MSIIMLYADFGRLLTAARLAGGFPQKTELAVHLNVGPQTVSRWEQGASRPKLEKLKQIVDLLKMDAEAGQKLIEAAGYDVASKVTATFDKPLPLDALSPESFERFCAALVLELYPAAQVNRFGDQGHAQQGVDVEVRFPDGKYIVIQCKRQASFGPARVDEAVAKLAIAADRKLLLLSSTASPDVRRAIQQHAGWELWDREDITRQLRHQLDPEAQKRIVDIYFKGQRFALLGVAEPSVWRTTKAFFAGTSVLNDNFSHDWELVGREEDLRKLEEFARSEDQVVRVLAANGGSGKTRVLRALAERLESSGYNRKIYFLSREALTTGSFEDLSAGPKFLVCDDAHDRSDIALLAEYVAVPSNNAKLLLSLRPYGLALLRQQARALMLSDTPEIRLAPLKKPQVTALAEQALRHFGAAESLAKPLADQTLDCPLATVIGAKVLAARKNHPAFLRGESAFRSELYARLTDIVVEDTSSGMDPKAIRRTLSCIALIQPIRDGDRSLIAAIADIAKLEDHEVAQAIKRLKDASVLFARADLVRVSPDLLGDFLVEDACIDEHGRSTGYAEKAFDSLDGQYVGNLLLNLGRIDWARQQGDTGRSQLMDGLWSRVQWGDEFYSPQVEAAVAVAYYQPRQALALARRLIGQAQINDSVAKLIENAAFNIEYLDEACALLWSIGRDDKRGENRHPHHGMRVLTELATPRPDKPMAYVHKVIDYALRLLPQDASWTSAHTPVEILRGALATEGHTTVATPRALTMSPFILSQNALAQTRKKVVDVLIALLGHPDSRRGFQAAKALHSALAYPMGPFGARTSQENFDLFTEEFRQTLEDINTYLDTHDVAPAVLTRLSESVSWHANYCKGVTTPLAAKILARLDHGLSVRTIRMLIGGWGHMTRKVGDDGEFVGHDKMVASIVKEISDAFPLAKDRLRFMEDCLAEIATAGREIHGAAFILVGQLAADSKDFAAELIANALVAPQSRTAEFGSSGLAALLRLGYREAEPIVAGIVAKGDGPQLPLVAYAYTGYKPQDGYTKTDLLALQQVITSKQPAVLFPAADAVHQVFGCDRALGLDLFANANLAQEPAVAHKFIMWIAHGNGGPAERFNADQFTSVLHRLIELPSLDDYWVQEFVKFGLKQHPEATLRFLVARIEKAAQSKDWRYSPSLPRFRTEPLGFAPDREARTWLAELLDLALAKFDDDIFRIRFAELIGSLFGPYDDTFTATVETWAFNRSRHHLQVVAAVLHEGGSSFIFEHAAFVIRLMSYAQTLGDELLRSVRSALFGAAISGVRSGVPGQPFPEDLNRRDCAQKVLAQLTKADAAYDLYEDVLREANRCIDDQIRKGKRMDELEAANE